MLLGLLGSFTGVLLGLLLYRFTPVAIGNLLPIQLNLVISWNVVAKGFVLGMLLSAIFSAWPLMSVRFVPPLAALRADFTPAAVRSKARIAVQMAAIFSLCHGVDPDSPCRNGIRLYCWPGRSSARAGVAGAVAAYGG